MSVTAVRALSVVVGVCFVFFGTLKLAPLFSEDLYRSTRKIFIKTYSSFPLGRFTGWNPSPNRVRRVHGCIEVVGGLVLAITTGLTQDVASATLLGLMLFNLFSIWHSFGDPKDASNSIVFSLMLACRFVIRAQNFQSAQDSQAEEKELTLMALRRRIALIQKGFSEIEQTKRSTPCPFSSDQSVKERPSSEK